jgi:hypothetical protein
MRGVLQLREAMTVRAVDRGRVLTAPALEVEQIAHDCPATPRALLMFDLILNSFFYYLHK